MVVKVVDASVMAAILFDEPHSETASASLKGARLVAPALLGFELANVCIKKCRRRPTERDAIMTAFAKRDRFEVKDAPVDHDGVLRLAATTSLSAYDASYLWLSRRLGAELITLDRRLATAAAGDRP